MLAAAGVLVLLGVVLFALQNVLDPKPDPECVSEGTTSSGAVSEDDDSCRVSIESYEEIRDWETKPKLYRVLGLVVILGGIGTGVASIVVGRRPKAPPALS